MRQERPAAKNSGMPSAAPARKQEALSGEQRTSDASRARSTRLQPHQEEGTQSAGELIHQAAACPCRVAEQPAQRPA